MELPEGIKRRRSEVKKGSKKRQRNLLRLMTLIVSLELKKDLVGFMNKIDVTRSYQKKNKCI